MFTQEILEQLYRHMEWADATVWRTVLVRPDPPDERLRLLMTHIHVVQRAFLHVWTGRPIASAFRNPGEFATLRDLLAWARPYYAEAHERVRSASPERLREPVVLPWADQLAAQLGRPPAASTLGDTCFQVTSHTTHHRGQVNIRLRELGAEPPLVDYIAWVWFGRPQATWD